MAASKIEWVNRVMPDGRMVQGFTFNPWIGCTKVSPACDNCYAERDAALRRGMVVWGSEGTRRVTVGDYWGKMESFARTAWKNGTDRPLVFCASWADVFEEWDGDMLDQNGRALRVTRENSADLDCGWRSGEAYQNFRAVTMDDARARLFRLIARTSYVFDWLLLTKRPYSMKRRWPELMTAYNSELDRVNKDDARYQHVVDKRDKLGMAPNIWGGVTVEGESYVSRAKVLSEIPLVRRFVSAEPMFEPIDKELKPWLSTLDWVIAGGESGPDARPHDPQWFRSLRDDAKEAGVPFLFKQWGEWAPTYTPDPLNDFQFANGQWVKRIGRAASGRTLDGVIHHDVPESALVQPWSQRRENEVSQVRRRNAAQAT